LNDELIGKNVIVSLADLPGLFIHYLFSQKKGNEFATQYTPLAADVIDQRYQIGRKCYGKFCRQRNAAAFRTWQIKTITAADALKVSRQTVIEILRERRSVMPIMALRLSRLFGNTPEFWLNAQNVRDIWDFEQHFENELKQIHPLDAS
jgi:addiction module HigA family antidote